MEPSSPTHTLPRSQKNTQERGKKNLSNMERKGIIDYLLLHAKNNLTGTQTAQRGAVKAAAAHFKVSRVTVSRLWRKAKAQLEVGLVIDVGHKMEGNVGRKRLQVNLESVADIPLRRRTTIRSLASAAGVCKTTAHNWVKRGILRSHSNAIKPTLNDANRIQRLKYCLDQVDEASISSNPSFKSFKNVLHIDEKWFFMTKTSQKYYLTKDEDEPYRTCQSKRFITKIMFLGVIGRPVISEAGVVLWDGKVGIFPFVENVQAKRKSKNREAGSLETKPISSVTKEVFKSMLLHKVIPAIQEKWPTFMSKEIVMQQDNARPHIPGNDIDYVLASTSNGFKISLTNQPPNSPDLNILDLGFFRAIQSVKDKAAPTNVTELVEAVIDAYNAFPPPTLNKVWLTYQKVMEEIMKGDGGNNYKLPHMGKESMEREGRLPYVLQLEEGLYERISRKLYDHNGPAEDVQDTHESLMGQFIFEEEEDSTLPE